MLGVCMRRHLQPPTVLASSGGLGPVILINTASALGHNIMEMKSQDTSVNYGAEAIETIPSCKVDSNRDGWGQLSPQNSRPATVCYATNSSHTAGAIADVSDGWLSPQQIKTLRKEIDFRRRRNRLAYRRLEDVEVKGDYTQTTLDAAEAALVSNEFFEVGG